MKEIKICESHQYYKVPLIWTFAFIGAEYWCPFCGYSGGMLGAGRDVPSTKHLVRKLEKYKKLSRLYLRAVASQCASRVKYGGVWYDRYELPERAIKRLEKIRSQWKYRQRV